MEDHQIIELEKRLEKVESELRQLIRGKSQEKGNSDRMGKESPREFLLNYNAKNDVERTLFAIAYLEKKGVEEIFIDGIKKTLIEMREKSNFNISDKIQQLDKKGFLLPNGQKGKKKLWLITNKGLKFLEGLKQNAK